MLLFTKSIELKRAICKNAFSMSPVRAIGFARNTNNKSNNFGSKQGPLYNLSFKLGLSSTFTLASNTTRIFVVERFSLTTSLWVK